MTASYLDVISEYFPSYNVQANGAGNIYEQLIWNNVSNIPSKQQLDELRLELNRKYVWEQIKEKRNLIKDGGIKVGKYWFHSDEASRLEYLGLLMLTDNFPVNLQWKTMSGEFCLMTKDLASEIFKSLSIRNQHIFAIAEQHKKEMQLVDNPYTYNYSLNWPEVFNVN